jgi:hypothetical protein
MDASDLGPFPWDTEGRPTGRMRGIGHSEGWRGSEAGESRWPRFPRVPLGRASVRTALLGGDPESREEDRLGRQCGPLRRRERSRRQSFLQEYEKGRCRTDVRNCAAHGIDVLRDHRQQGESVENCPGDEKKDHYDEPANQNSLALR